MSRMRVVADVREPELPLTCDAGGCDKGSIGLAWWSDTGWLPVCSVHLYEAEFAGHPTIIDCGGGQR